MKKVLVVDIGGTHVKLMLSRANKRKFDSSPRMGPRALVAGIKAAVAGWKFDAISIGFPAPVRDGRILKEPSHLGKGWIGYNFASALRKPVRVINDAAMQALGSYRGKRMLFLGLGTGIGSAMMWPGTLLPLELGHLPYVDDGILEDRLGKIGLEELGRKAWQREVLEVANQMKIAFVADYVVLGGGNSKILEKLPAGVVLGENRNAYLGGTRLWQMIPGTKRSRWQIL